ncbi:site-specific integrase [Tropicimonas sp. IMCC6043]|uniref:tyrosine-type recombinase/integrase n=1 Tax=Tropicimonas sp. IMCC6043 TaxID=2510645 RepID=UPI00101E15FD|nr:site-specific integrase [Tropicimonas sp. IMCC6043]RYH08830.1 site-specific integrase [Tropicimonas sp. IMCC6043]
MRAGKLTVAKVRQLDQPGRYSDGGCLYVVVAPGGSKHWIARLTIHGRQTDMGLGGVSYVTLAEAREETARLRKIARNGGDPRAERRRETITFEEAANRVHAGLLPTWKNKKHAETWLSTIRIYANPHFGSRPIETVTTADCLKVLSPIWTEKHETAKRLRQRLRTVFDWAKGAGFYPNENPINGLKKALPAVKQSQEHLPSMPWQSVPAFMTKLKQRQGVSARVLEFIILTAVRSGEARGAEWSEINDSTWTVPAIRMKRGIEHRVPLSEQALDVLERVRGLGETMVFPSPILRHEERQMSDIAVNNLLKRMGNEDVTVHGFRSSFRVWASERAHADREVAEAAMSHARGNEVERAYDRSDLFERRRSLMDAWGRYCAGEAGDVVQMVRA